MKMEKKHWTERGRESPAPSLDPPMYCIVLIDAVKENGIRKNSNFKMKSLISKLTKKKNDSLYQAKLNYHVI